MTDAGTHALLKKWADAVALRTVHRGVYSADSTRTVSWPSLENCAWSTLDTPCGPGEANDAFPWGAGHGTLRRHAQVSRQAMHYAHKGINALMSCDKAFQNPCHSAKRERKYVQQHIRICTHGVKTGLG